MASDGNIKASARINKEWGVRLGLIAALFIGGGCWFLYDGLVKYPKQREMYRLVYEMNDEGGAIKRPDWREKLEAAGYSTDIDPDKLSNKSDTDILTQRIIAGLCFPVGLLALFWLVLNSFRTLYADERGVQFGGSRMAFDEVDQIDKTRWDSKGIAVLRGRDGKKLVLDDWKFRGAADVLAETERHVRPTASDDPSSSDAQPPADEPADQPADESAEDRAADAAPEPDRTA